MRIAKKFRLYIYCKKRVIIPCRDMRGEMLFVYAYGPISASKVLVSESGYKKSSASRVYLNKIERVIKPGVSFVELLDENGNSHIVEFQ